MNDRGMHSLSILYNIFLDRYTTALIPNNIIDSSNHIFPLLLCRWHIAFSTALYLQCLLVRQLSAYVVVECAIIIVIVISSAFI